MTFKNVYRCKLVGTYDMGMSVHARVEMLEVNKAAFADVNEIVCTSAIVGHTPGVIVTRNSVYLYETA